MKLEFWKKPEEKKEFENKGGFKSIRSCLIDSKHIDPLTRSTISLIEKNGLFVNYDGDRSFLKDNNLKNAGEYTYVISESNEQDKYSKRYCNCTGIVVIGEQKDSDKQISFLSHQDPWKFLYGYKKDFSDHLVKEIRNIKNKVKESSVDVVIFGGKTGNGDEYLESIKFLSSILKQEFNFEPTVLTGPNKKNYINSTRIYLDTQNRRLYIIRPSQESEVNENYLPSKIEEQSVKWK